MFLWLMLSIIISFLSQAYSEYSEANTPGQPPLFIAPTNLILPADTGSYLVDINSALHPKFPLEPSLRSILTLKPNFKLSEIDIFGCGNTIGNLLAFVSGELVSFRMGVECLKESLILVRKTNEPEERIRNVRGYGHTFVEATGEWQAGVRDSRSHQRVLAYEFGALKMVVRCEGDAYIDDGSGGPLQDDGDGIIDAKTKDDFKTAEDGDDMVVKNEINDQNGTLVDIKKEDPDEGESTAEVKREIKVKIEHAEDDGDIGGDTLPKYDDSDTVSAVSKLTIEQGGKEISRQRITELKTRALDQFGQRTNSATQFAQRLWVKQIPNLVLAYHNGGEFKEKNIDVIDMRKSIDRWEEAHQKELTKFERLLIDLKKAVRSCGGKAELRREDNGPIELWSERDEWSALPDDLKVDWNDDSE